MSLNSIDVKNNGNISETFKLMLVSEPNASWASVTAASPGAEQYRFSGIFRSAVPAAGDFSAEDAFSASVERISSAVNLAKDSDAAGEKGLNVTKGSTRKLWFKLETPASTQVTTTQSIPVRIIALP